MARMRRHLLLAAFGLLLAGIVAGSVRARDDEQGPYRAVIVDEFQSGKWAETKEFRECPEVTDALNRLDSEGYRFSAVMLTPSNDLLVISRK